MTSYYLGLILFSLATLILLLILYDSWNRVSKKLAQKSELPNLPFNIRKTPSLGKVPENVGEDRRGAPSRAIALQEDLIILSIVAPSGNCFESYDLLQAISATGMQFGERNLFHFYETNQGEKTILFSLASATEDGQIDINQMGDFSCKGLILFMDIFRVLDPHSTFRLMLETAQHLADDLGGELRADPSTPWNENMFDEYQQKIAEKQSIPML